MYQNDYIMRMVEQFAGFLTRIVEEKERRKYDNALFQIGAAYGELFGVDRHLIHKLGDEHLVGITKNRGAVVAQKCLIIGELMRQEAETLELDGQNNPKIPGIYCKSLGMYLEGLIHDKELRQEAHVEVIEWLFKRLADFDLPLWLEQKMFRYNEEMGSYARAEDSLYRLVELDADLGRKEGKAFYERLLKKSDDELQSGGLPRQEVQAGLSMLDEG